MPRSRCALPGGNDIQGFVNQHKATPTRPSPRVGPDPKAISPPDPAARYTASANSVAGYAYSDNYLIDLKHAVIVFRSSSMNTSTARLERVLAPRIKLDGRPSLQRS
jgi:hypothetical protein